MSLSTEYHGFELCICTCCIKDIKKEQFLLFLVGLTLYIIWNLSRNMDILHEMRGLGTPYLTRFSRYRCCPKSAIHSLKGYFCFFYGVLPHILYETRIEIWVFHIEQGISELSILTAS